MRFHDIPGHEPLKQQLIRVVVQQRMPHAQLFAGMAGSGALALALAQITYLHCKAPTSQDACGVCVSCKQMARCVHPQVRFLFPTAGKKALHTYLAAWRQFLLTQPFGDLTTWQNQLENAGFLHIPTLHMQEATESLFLMPNPGDYNVLVIWHPEYLHTTTQQKLLKILEDPPPQTLFFLVSAQYQKLSHVLRSRLQLIRVLPCAPNALQHYLTHRYGLSNLQAQEKAILANGNIANAVALVSEHAHGQQTFDAFCAWMRACYTYDYQALVVQAKTRVKATKDQQMHFWYYALHLFRAALSYRLKATDVAPLTDTQAAFMNKFCMTISTVALQQCIEWVNQALTTTLAHGNMALTYMHTSLQIAAIFIKPTK